MKKTFLYSLAVMALVIPAVVFAAEFRTGDQPSIGAGERVTNDIYLVGGNVTSAGTVAGDVVAGGGSVIISGDVEADVVAGGGNVTILSDVGDDVRAGGGTIVVQGKVGGDLIIGGGQVTIGGSGIGGDAVIGGGVVRLDAPVAGNVRIGGGNIYINAPITGNVTIYDADKVTLGSGAVISGNLKYKAKKELTMEDGAIVKGQTTFEPRAERRASRALLAGLVSFVVLVKFLTLLLAALVIGLVFRRYSMEAIAKVVERPLLELGKGLVVFAALPVISIMLLVTVLGIPFGILGVLAFIILMMFAWIVAPVIIGSIAYRYFSNSEMEVSWKTILLGVLIFEVLGFIPLLGWLAQALSMLITIGVIVAIKWQVVKEWR